ncbi:MAG: hypothetical protein AAGU27_15050 [Dehalobacterium sp.]
MKSKRSLKKVILGTLIALFFTISYLSWISMENSTQELVYNIKKSRHANFLIEQDIVVINDRIVVNNNSNKDLYFFMYADVKEDEGLMIEDFAPACKRDSLEKEKFFIRAKSETSFSAHFKAKKGEKTTKYDRRPPNDIKFELAE